MSSPTDQTYDPNDPSAYAPRWVRNAPNQHRDMHAKGQIGHELDETRAPTPPDQFLVDGFTVPLSLTPEIVPDPWPAHRSSSGRLFRVLGHLALAGSAAAVIALVAIGKLSIPGSIGAAEEDDNRVLISSRFAGPTARPQDQPGAPARSSEPHTQVALADATPVQIFTAPAPVERAPPPKIAALAPARSTTGPNITISAPGMTPAVTALDPESEEALTLLKRGEQLAAAGDMAAARLMLRRAAEAHNARAALALGATYDPNVLATLGIYGVVPDTAAARSWYEKAKEYGSAEAPQRLEMLVRQRL
jgi:hypothetical protein